MDHAIHDATSYWRHDAQALSRAYAAGALSPEDVAAAAFERIARLNPGLNAIVTLDRAGALAAAQASAARWRAGAALGPLDGVPVTVKDSLLTRGLRTTWGSRLYADFVPDADELPVARLRAAGAVILGKTNVCEFTVQGYTDNPLFGVTRNPWDPRLTPGGSSGGAVAAVSAGLAPLAIGTDGGGSIRRPASHTGLVGLKPSQGRAPRHGGFPVITPGFEVVGPLTRSVADAAALLAVLAGPDARDPASTAYAPFQVDLATASPPQRILYVPRFGDAPVDQTIAASVAAAAHDLAALGHQVEEAPPPFDADGFNAVWSFIGQTGVAWLMRQHPDWRGRIGPSLAEMAEAGARLGATDYLAALDKVEMMRRQLGAAFARVDLLLTPSAAALPWPAAEIYPPMIDGKPVGPRGHAIFTAFVNAAGCPAVNLPCAPAPDGMPIGFQLVGRWGAEALLLQLAAQYERARPWADRWPALALG